MWKITRPDAVAVLNDELAKRSLARYFAIIPNKKTAKFMIAKKLSAEFDKNSSRHFGESMRNVLRILSRLNTKLTRKNFFMKFLHPQNPISN